MNDSTPSTGQSATSSRGGADKRVQTFQALRHRSFRSLWISLIVSSVGTWIQIISQSLLVLKITDGSAFALGAVSLTQALAFFVFALLGGGLADRLDKRRLLLLTQSLSMSLACLLGILTLAGVIQVWMIVCLAFCSGIVLSFDQPARASLVSLLVPQADLLNAISLQSVVFNGSAVLGPAIGGVTVGVFAALGQQFGLTLPLVGYAGNFFLNALSYLAILLVLYYLHLPASSAAMVKRGSMLSSIRAALAAVGHDRVLPWMLMGYGVLLFFGPSPALMLPSFAQNLNLSDVQLGLFFSAIGLGTVLGALLIASLGDFRHKSILLLVSFLLWCISLALFALSHLFGLSLLALLILGISQNGVSSTVITLLQTRVAPTMRGRVMSLNTLFIMGVRPLGDFPIGALMQGIGGPTTVLLCTALVAVYMLYLGALQLLDRPFSVSLALKSSEE